MGSSGIPSIRPLFGCSRPETRNLDCDPTFSKKKFEKCHGFIEFTNKSVAFAKTDLHFSRKHKICVHIFTMIIKKCIKSQSIMLGYLPTLSLDRCFAFPNSNVQLFLALPLFLRVI